MNKKRCKKQKFTKSRPFPRKVDIKEVMSKKRFFRQKTGRFFRKKKEHFSEKKENFSQVFTKNRSFPSKVNINGDMSKKLFPRNIDIQVVMSEKRLKTI